MSVDVSDDEDSGGRSSVGYLWPVVCPIMSLWMMGAWLGGGDMRAIDVDDCEWCGVCVLLVL